MYYLVVDRATCPCSPPTLRTSGTVTGTAIGGSNPSKGIMKVCKNCEISFVEKCKIQVFCSKNCAAIFNNKSRLTRLYKLGKRTCCGCKAPLLNYQNKYCSEKCKIDGKLILTEQKILSGKKVHLHTLRRYLFKVRPNECEICKRLEWNGVAIPLVMDHIDGNPANNKIENLRLICPNCDRLTSTFGSKNRGFGRKSRGLLRYDTYKKP
jgi:hypothetical protein